MKRHRTENLDSTEWRRCADGNEKLRVKHGGVISVLVVRPTSSRGIRPRFHIPGIETALACTIHLPIHGRVGPGGHQTTLENWVETSSVARNWTIKSANALEFHAYFTVCRVLLPAGRRVSTSHLFRDHGRCDAPDWEQPFTFLRLWPPPPTNMDSTLLFNTLAGLLPNPNSAKAEKVSSTPSKVLFL